jgi:pimeloyl-ACP methyl ester carboxylesterase
MKNEIVVLLHGIFRTKRSMRTLEKALIKQGYQVLNMGYPSTKKRITEIASVIFDEMNQISSISEYKIHFVAYSMGCLVVRELLAKHPINNVGNIVMIAPPNQGSEVADFLENNFLYKHFYGPAGMELTTHFARLNPFPRVQHRFGVIAGNVCLDPISYFILPKDNDGKVTIESTKLEGMSDHIVLPCSHTFIIINKVVIEQVKYFLRNGQFSRLQAKSS